MTIVSEKQKDVIEDFKLATKERKRLEEVGLYLSEEEHSSCGVGMVVAIDGKPRREVVLKAVEALKAVWHRGAVDADGKTGDGAGIHIQLPTEFFEEHIRRSGHSPGKGRLCVGQIFLPRTDLTKQEQVREIIESEIIEANFNIYGWRQVPIDVDIIGEKANITRPEIEQIMFEDSHHSNDKALEQKLYIVRRRIENRFNALNLLDAYICSFSCRSIIYKGLFLAEQITEFYSDFQDERFISNFAIYHQRYSTNTFPAWPLAQPFRVLAHNGEINTLKGNINWMTSHEAIMSDVNLSPYLSDIRPVIQPNSSDSAALDSVFELLLRGERQLPEAKSILIPEAWKRANHLDQGLRDFYHYAHGIMEPWDGPASICAYDGEWVLGGLDRNGLRPLRYHLDSSGLLILGSETGMVKVDKTQIIEKGRIGPGGMIAVNLTTGKLFHDHELKKLISEKYDYGKWVQKNTGLKDLKIKKIKPSLKSENLLRHQHMAGWTSEDVELILHPMLVTGKEATGSMGDDSALAVLSERYRGLHHYLRQNFSQVTNPPIDSLRERIVMSLSTRLGNLQGNILDPHPEKLQFTEVESPILFSNELAAITDSHKEISGGQTHQLDCTLALEQNMTDRIVELQNEAEEAVARGVSILILSDENSGSSRIILPMVLALSAIHSHLIKTNLRTFSALAIKTSEVLDTHSYAVLLGVGATTITPYLVEASLFERHRQGLTNDLTPEDLLQNYRKAVDDGILKIMAKMGISVLSSYRGGYNFEAIGLSRTLVHNFFPGMQSRISGIGIHGIEEKIRHRHTETFEDETVTILPVGGFYRSRIKNDAHAWEGRSIHMLQTAVTKNEYSLYQKYTEILKNIPPITIRDLLDFTPNRKQIALDEVEQVTLLRRRMISPGISLGALSPIAHETLSIAMNRIGARSDSGEGGEDPERFHPRDNGDNPSSAIKQVASGRFGVTAEYLNNCDEIEIKMAQGAKPGEGGQLPGYKVSELIAKLRHSTKGVTLISPPPHHDIYSIEDLAQLIYDLKQINPRARVCVKLVARSGIGTIAAGVAKAKADTILISGHSGGTGASPQSSIKYAGLPWEIGLSEVHQVLTLNRLRHKVKLRTDGGIKTGRDIVIAALLGAEEFGIGTASLVAMGCIMVRQCHSNTCPVGVCTQDQDLIDRFSGTPEKVVNLFTFIAQEVREILAELGLKTLDEIIGRTDLLMQVSRGSPSLDDLDLNPLLTRADPGKNLARCAMEAHERNQVPDTLDAQILKDTETLFSDKKSKIQLHYSISNTQRAIGTRISSHITQHFGMSHLKDGHLTIKLEGTAGQSLGAFGVQGLKLIVSGDANDYVGKGLSGAEIIIAPPPESRFQWHRNVIIGNTCLYGATAGSLFAAGLAGERFAVRNSGSTAVIEGCGTNGCEYMTGGVVVILGPIGVNFGAGMTGGQAFIYDPKGKARELINPQTIKIYEMDHEESLVQLHKLIKLHVHHTGSSWAQEILNNWAEAYHDFVHVVPHEIKDTILGKKDQSQTLLQLEAC